MRLLRLLVLLLALAALPASATAGPDRVTGGVTVPDGRLTGGGADGGEPATPEPDPTAAAAAITGAAGAPAARAAQEAEQPGSQTTPEQPEDDEDVEVRVPVPEETRDQQATATTQRGGLGGLAQTGYAVAVLAVAGALSAAAGLGLRRLTRS